MNTASDQQLSYEAAMHIAGSHATQREVVPEVLLADEGIEVAQGLPRPAEG